MLGGEFLANLNAAAVAVHIAEAADIHQNVEAELLPGAEGAQHFIVASAMAQAQIDDLAANRIPHRLDRHANLPVGIVAMFIDQRGGQLGLQRLVIQQVDKRGGGDRQVSHQLSRDLLRNSLTPGFEFIGIGIGILHQCRRHANFLQQFLLGAVAQLRRNCANLAYQFLQRFLIHVVRRRRGRAFQQLAEMAYLFVRVRKQMRNLRLQRARIHDLAQRSVDRQRQQIAREVKSPRPQGAIVGFLLHLRRVWA